jgi:hypothetical protein
MPGERQHALSREGGEVSRLEIQETVSRPVTPTELFVPTHIEVAPGERYAFVARGLWRDAVLTRGPNGWTSPLKRWNRLRGQPFFMLCGCIGTDEATAFPIGERCDWFVPPIDAGVDHHLHLFANDWRCMYWNNHDLPPEKGGPLTVSITRIA